MARVLVVDDEDDVRSMLALAIGADGYAVDQAPDGPTALRMLGERPYDLVVLDVTMPGMSGRAVTRAVRADPRLRALPVILLTTITGSRGSGAGRGADLHLAKPVDLPTLRAEVARLLEENEAGVA